ncbi:MAG TPA: histidine phosphatase family protein [Candidatus Saccharimonadales bacterium]|nr:histidine phosphatase family protein [Candidatus Saccharimonadales bacterium]
MRIGLLRHFPVEQRFPTGWSTAAELQVWRQRYDASPAILGQADLGALHWSECISSDLERAAATAKAVFPGTIEQTTLLREPEFAPFQTGPLLLPVWLWRWILRLAWMTGHKSQRASRDEFRRRVLAAADLLEGRSGDILVVSHAGMMAFLSAELRGRGFVGPKLRIAEHARLYVYERPAATRRASSPGGANESISHSQTSR